jgi:signal peptidase II
MPSATSGTPIGLVVKRRAIFALGLLIVAADQASKLWARQTFEVGASRTLIPGLLDLTLVTNRGAAFGIFQHGTACLAALSLVAVIAISVFALRLRTPIASALAVGVALPLGGSAGNLIDRVHFGWVTDFILVHWKEHQFPVFNVADSSICVGVAILMYYYSRVQEPAAKPVAETVKQEP